MKHQSTTSEEAVNNSEPIHRLYLALGTNVGDKKANIKKAYDEIEKKIGKIVATSSHFITRPEGFSSNNLFVNCACEVHTMLDIVDIFAHTQSIEKEMGRQHKSQFGIYVDRIIDIDILFFDHLVINTSQLTVPHPRLHQRLFVLNPLCEIAPRILHPRLNKTIQELRALELKRREDL